MLRVEHEDIPHTRLNRLDIARLNFSQQLCEGFLVDVRLFTCFPKVAVKKNTTLFSAVLQLPHLQRLRVNILNG
ncbi:hypothetical protein D3C80_2026520 [compost metagenome]